MTSKFNPYKQWLGLKTQFIKPHYFELFDLSPSLKSQDEITEIVDAAAKRCLKLLAEVPAGENDRLVEEIQERVLRAQKILSNPKTRLAYHKQLKLKTQERSTPLLTKPEPFLSPPVKGKPAEQERSPASDLQPPTLKNGADTPASIPPPKSNTESARPPMAAKPVAVATPSGLPMAIPLAKPLSSPVPVESAESGSPMMGGVKINPKIRRRRSSKSLAFLAMLLMFTMLAGGGYLIFLNWSVIENLGGMANANDPTTPDSVDGDSAGASGSTPIVSPSDVSDDPDVDPRPLPRIDLTKLDELDEDAVKKADMARNKKDKKDKKDKGGDGVMPPDGDASVVEKEDGMSKEKAADPSDDSKPKDTVVVKFSELQMAQYKRYIDRARHSLFRRDKARAKRAIDNAQRIKREAGSESESQFVEEQADVASLADELAEIYDLCDGFWEQVIASGSSIQGGQELVASKQRISLVESDEDKVIVRNAGSNITYEYSFLPPQLAVVLAKQGSIEDIPTWNKQLAAFYAVNQVTGADYLGQIDELLKESEAAGHSCEGIRHFSMFKFDTFGTIPEKVGTPNKKTQQEGILGFRTEQEYKSVSDLSAGRAVMAAQALEDQLANDVSQNVIFLEEIRKLGIRSGDSGIVADAVRELGGLSSINVATLLCESYLEMADSELSVSQRRGLMEVAIPYLKSDYSRKSKLRSREQLVQALGKLAQVYGMSDAARRLNQVELK